MAAESGVANMEQTLSSLVAAVETVLSPTATQQDRAVAHQVLEYFLILPFVLLAIFDFDRDSAGTSCLMRVRHMGHPVCQYREAAIAADFPEHRSSESDTLAAGSA